MKQPITDELGNEYTCRFARFLGKWNKEVRDMDSEAKMIPVNVSMKVDDVGDGFFNRAKKVLSIFKRKK